MSTLFDRRLVFVTGKGGVGKTTVALALGLAAARRGARAIVCEVSNQERVSRLLGREGVGYHETEIADGLSAISVDQQHALEEWVGYQLPSRRLAHILSGNRIFQYLTAAAPGIKELVTIGKIWELAQLDRKAKGARPYDFVVVDAPATGHGLGLLRAPRTFGDIARVGPIRHQADRIHDFIVDRRRTGIVAVALAEEMPVNETLEYRELLEERMKLQLDAVVVNAVYPERFTAPELERIAAANGSPGGAPHPALHAALAEHARAGQQREQVARLAAGLGSVPVISLPFLFEPELGLGEVEELSHLLEGA